MKIYKRLVMHSKVRQSSFAVGLFHGLKIIKILIITRWLGI